ncbi:MAG: hypothetical protein KF823_12280 [Xanthomonadales bacterium]|nr:hypothetical protein [Xanthomonadales bacterium]
MIEDLGTLLRVEDDYVDFNREERNYAAVLYHHLMAEPAAMSRFLQLVAPGVNCEDGYPHIYFEYAHVRDLWEQARRMPHMANLVDRNTRYFNAMLAFLRSDCEDGVVAGVNKALDKLESGVDRRYRRARATPSPSGPALVEPIDTAFVERFNRVFVAGRQSVDQLQSPARWSAVALGQLARSDKTLAETACRLKWAFNAKADLVIHTGRRAAVCIEIKLDSKTSTYTMPPLASGKDGNAVDSPFKMSQLGLQQYILESLLGFDARFAILGRPGPGGVVRVPDRYTDDPKRPNQTDDPRHPKGISWRQAFEAVLGAGFCADGASRGFTDRMVRLVCKEGKS